MTYVILAVIIASLGGNQEVMSGYSKSQYPTEQECEAARPSVENMLLIGLQQDNPGATFNIKTECKALEG